MVFSCWLGLNHDTTSVAVGGLHGHLTVCYYKHVGTEWREGGESGLVGLVTMKWPHRVCPHVYIRDAPCTRDAAL